MSSSSKLSIYLGHTHSGAFHYGICIIPPLTAFSLDQEPNTAAVPLLSFAIAFSTRLLRLVVFICSRRLVRPFTLAICQIRGNVTSFVLP
jgi:hypothetical protein